MSTTVVFLLLLHVALLLSIFNNATAVIAQNGECPLLYLYPFSDLQTREWSPFHAQYSFSILSSIMMAIDHINTRNGGVIPQLATPEFDECGFRIPSLAVGDSQGYEDPAVSTVLNVFHGTGMEHRKYMPGFESNNNELLVPCAVIGDTLSNICMALASLTGNYFETPQISPVANGAMLEDASLFPLFTRILDSNKGTALALLEWLLWHERDYIGVIYVENEYGTSFWETFEDLAKARGLSVRGHSFDFTNFSRDDGDSGSMYAALQYLKSTGFTTIVPVMYIPHFQTLVDSADDLGLVGQNFLWIFHSAIDFQFIFKSSQFQPGSAKDRFLSGVGYFIPSLIPLPTSPFNQIYQEQNATLVARVRDVSPVKEGMAGFFDAKDTFFQDQRYSVALGASEAYDAVIATALGACAAREQSSKANNGIATNVTGASHFDGIVSRSFIGASGNITFDSQRRMRDQTSTVYGMLNFRGSTDQLTGLQKYSAVLTATMVRGRWMKLNSFVYADGTTYRPTPLRFHTEERNYLGVPVRVAGLIIMSLGMSLSIGCAIMVYLKRDEDIIKSSQPTFLLMLCFGSTLISFCIFPFSLDENAGWSQKHLNIACAVTPWICSIGYIIIYSALFSKLWRIDKVLQFRRRQVFVRHVIGPFIVLLLLVIACLTVWTIFDPLQWDRRTLVVDEYGFVVESYGSCQSKNWEPFTFSLVSVGLFSTLITLFMAWKTRDIPDRFASSKYIFYTVFTQTQVWAVAIPVMAIVSSNSVDVLFLCRAFVFSLFGASTVIVVIGPKLRQQNRSNSSISSLTNPAGIRRRSSDISESSQSLTGTIQQDLLEVQKMEEEADFYFSQDHDGRKICNNLDEYCNGDETDLYSKDLERQSGCCSDELSEIVPQHQSHLKHYDQNGVEYGDEISRESLYRTSTTEEDGDHDHAEYENGLSPKREISASALKMDDRLALDETGLKNNDGFDSRKEDDEGTKELLHGKKESSRVKNCVDRKQDDPDEVDESYEESALLEVSIEEKYQHNYDSEGQNGINEFQEDGEYQELSAARDLEERNEIKSESFTVGERLVSTNVENRGETEELETSEADASELRYVSYQEETTRVFEIDIAPEIVMQTSVVEDVSELLPEDDLHNIQDREVDDKYENVSGIEAVQVPEIELKQVTPGKRPESTDNNTHLNKKACE